MSGLREQALDRAANSVLSADAAWKEYPDSQECMDAFYAAVHEQNAAIDAVWFPVDALEKLAVGK